MERETNFFFYSSAYKFIQAKNKEAVDVLKISISFLNLTSVC